MSDWWEAIEQELDAQSNTAPDPWSHLFGEDDGDLTDAEQRFLAALSDQPEITRLTEEDDPPENAE